MFISHIHTESGDHYLVGPWSKKPTANEILDTFGNDHPEEADLLEEMIERGDLDKKSIKAIKLPDEPGVVSL